jgi:Phage stabilisation protein
LKTPILGSAYVARSINAADNRCVNLFPELIPEGGKEAAFFNRAPGLKFQQTVGTGPIRALWAHQTNGADFYVVSGNEVYKLTSLTGTPVKLGNVSGTGPVSIADNGTQLFFACNPDGYIYNETTNVFSQITDPDFPGAVTVQYLDGYFVFNEPNSQRLWVTSLLDGTAIDPLDFASAEGSPDGVAAVAVQHRELWVFGTDTVEVWYDAGLAAFPMAPIQGALNEIGCAAAFSVAKLDNALFWLGADARGYGIVYRNKGYSGERISTHAIEYAIQQYTTISDAVGYTYQQEGHAFYVLNFPTANATWVYDVSTQAWHERAGFSNGAFTRHRSNCQCNFNYNTVIGDYQNGNIYTFDLNVYADNSGVQKWLRSWRALPTGQNNLKRTAHHSLQLDAETGVGLNGYPAYDAQDLTTEVNDVIIAEFVQGYLTTQAGNQLVTEAGDGNEPLVTQVQPLEDFNGYALETNAYPATAGYDPQVMLRWSDDGGHTWSNEHWNSMGKIGTYGTRTIWRRLGMTEKIRDRVYEVSGTDPIKIAIVGAELFITPTNS